MANKHYIILLTLCIWPISLLYAGGNNCRTASNAKLMGYNGRVKRVTETTWRADKSKGVFVKTQYGNPGTVKTITFDKTGKVTSYTVLDKYNQRTTASTFTWPAADSMVISDTQISRKYEPYDTAMQQYTRYWLSSDSYRETFWKTERNNNRGDYYTNLISSEIITLDAQCRKIKADMLKLNVRQPFNVYTNVTYKGDSTITVYSYSSFPTRPTAKHKVMKRDAHGNPTLEVNVDFNSDKIIETTYEYY